MDKSLIKFSTNWTQFAGCDFSEAVQVQLADPDVFAKSPLEEIVHEESSILLQNNDCKDRCELYIKIFPQYKIQAFSLVCNVNKIEIFQGFLKEYLQTVYGIIVDEGETESDNGDEPESAFKTYRFDVEVEKSGITELCVRLLTNSSEICLFGIMLYCAPNPNGITTLVPSTSAGINIENVQNILQKSSANITPAAEKCKKFLELMAKTKSPAPTDTNEILRTFGDEAKPTLRELMQQLQLNNEDKLRVRQEMTKASSAVLPNDALTLYIDSSFRKMEQRLQQHLIDMEKRQTDKMNHILTYFFMHPYYVRRRRRRRHFPIGICPAPTNEIWEFSPFLDEHISMEPKTGENF